ncbi:MAG TPA: galactosyltransferase-related protein [Mycobacterium sp.]|nr:galactosyltransferase-related protein [Mycobacterium sp.]
MMNGRTLQIIDDEPDPSRPTRRAPGLLVVRRSHFLEVNGFDSNLHGWGWEDQDMIARLTLGVGLHRISRGNAIHVTHDDNLRVSEYREKDQWATRDRSFRSALANYDRGWFLGTYARDAQHISANLETAR